MTLNELKARATELGLADWQVNQQGPLTQKATWEKAILLKQNQIAETAQADAALAAEAEAENQAAAAAAAYNSPSAAVVVPIAFAAAVGTTFLKGVAGTVELLARR